MLRLALCISALVGCGSASAPPPASPTGPAGTGSPDRYSNDGFVLLGVIIEKVTRKSYHDHVEASVFKPATMTSTSSPFEDRPMAGRSIAYTKRLGGKAAAWTDATWPTAYRFAVREMVCDAMGLARDA